MAADMTSDNTTRTAMRCIRASVVRHKKDAPSGWLPRPGARLGRDWSPGGSELGQLWVRSSPTPAGRGGELRDSVAGIGEEAAEVGR